MVENWENGRLRRQLRYMLTVRAPDGCLVVSSPQLLQELSDDLDAAWNSAIAAAALGAWAVGRIDAGPINAAAHYLSSCVDGRYRQMVGTWLVSWPLDWMCYPPDLRWASPDFPVFDRSGRRLN